MNCISFSNVSNLAAKVTVTINEITGSFQYYDATKNPPGFNVYVTKFGGQFEIVPDGNVNSTFQPKKWTCDPFGLVDEYANFPAPTEFDPENTVQASWFARGGYPWGDPLECSSRTGYVGYIKQLPATGFVTFEPVGDAPPYPPYEVPISVQYFPFLAQYDYAGNILIPPVGEENPVCVDLDNLFPTGGFYQRETETGTRWTFNPRPGKEFYVPVTPNALLAAYGGVGLNGFHTPYATAIRNDDFRYFGEIYVPGLPLFFPIQNTSFQFFALFENGENLTLDWGSVEYTVAP